MECRQWTTEQVITGQFTTQQTISMDNSPPNKWYPWTIHHPTNDIHGQFTTQQMISMDNLPPNKWWPWTIHHQCWLTLTSGRWPFQIYICVRVRMWFITNSITQFTSDNQHRFWEGSRSGYTCVCVCVCVCACVWFITNSIAQQHILVNIYLRKLAGKATITSGCVLEDLKCWGARDTTCGHRAKDITPSIAWMREAWKE